MPRKSHSLRTFACAAITMMAMATSARAGLTSITLPQVALADDARLVSPREVDRSPQHADRLVTVPAEPASLDRYASIEDGAIWIPQLIEKPATFELAQSLTTAPINLSQQNVQQEYVVPLPPAVLTGAVMLAGNCIGLFLWKKKRI